MKMKPCVRFGFDTKEFAEMKDIKCKITFVHVSSYEFVKVSESYEVTFPILSFHLHVQILGQKSVSIRKKRKKQGETWADPKHLGMSGDKVCLGGFCTRYVLYVMCGGEGTEGSISNR